jgi:hypothetical protein
MKASTRLAVLWLVGWKLVDGIVTCVNCGLLGYEEFNQTLVLLAGVSWIGYGVAIPYLLLFAVFGLLFREGQEGRIWPGGCRAFYRIIFATAFIGPMSHVCVSLKMGEVMTLVSLLFAILVSLKMLFYVEKLDFN